MNPDDIDWSVTTWEGVRREHLRSSLRWTIRERLQAVEDMADVARHFQKMREEGKFRSLGEVQNPPK